MGIPSIETIMETLHSFTQDNLGQRDVLVLEEDTSFFQQTLHLCMHVIKYCMSK